MAVAEPTAELDLRFNDELATLAYDVRPAKAFGFGKGESFGQTRWRFESA